MGDKQKYAFSVSVKTAYLQDQSSIEDNRYAFSYTITITNIGDIAAQLISRHWIIADANGEVSEVKGLGVIGLPSPCCNPMRTLNTRAALCWIHLLAACMAHINWLRLTVHSSRLLLHHLLLQLLGCCIKSS